MQMDKPIDTDELLHLNRTLRMISECNQMLARAVDEAELLRAICRIAINFGGYHFSWVGRAEQDEAKTVRPLAFAGAEGDYLKAAYITWDEKETGLGPVGTAIRTRRPVIARYIATDPMMAPWREAALSHGYQSLIALPLVIQEEVLGAWMIYSAVPDGFDESEVALLTELTRDVVFGITALRIRADHQRAEEALRKSEATLQSVFWTAPVGIAILKEWVIESANKHWCEMLGCSEDSLIGKGTRILYENDLEYERVVKALSAGLREQGWASVESRQRVGDRFCDVILIVSPIQPDDFSAGIIAISYDITERKETEKKLERYRKKLEERVESRTSELQAAKDQLEAIFQSANVGIVVLRERLILQCNAQLEVIFGYGAGELTGQSTRLWYSDEASYTNTGKIVNEQIRRGEIHRCEQQLRRKDGSLFWARMTGRALDLADPDKGGMVGVVEDITAEREAADALRLAMAEQQAIFDSATSGIVLVKDRVIVRCNRKMDELFGYAPGTLRGQTTRHWYVDEKTFQAIGQETAFCLATGTTFHREQQLVRKNGTLFWGRMTAQAVDKSVPAKGLAGIIDDITTEREQAQILKRALMRAEEADRLKSAFLATMSHELRTPLNSIIGFTGILLQQLAGPLNKEQVKQLGMVQNSSRHLLALINDVLDISKIEAGQMGVTLTRFDLRALMAKVSENIRPQAERKGLSLVVRLASEIGAWESDPRRVEQILLNLLNNAVKFTDRGTVTLTAEVVSEELVVRVADTGIGIKSEDLRQLFQPFRQVDTGLTRQHEGTGLGLAICRRLAGLLGGVINAASDWGKGSVFTFTLPKKGPKEV